MTQNEIQELLDYNPNTGIFARLVSVSNVKAGTVCDHKEKTGYIVIGLKGKRYKAHRLAFLCMTGKVPEFVDHINHIRDDNRWNNLREASPKTNAKNQSLYKNNASGFTGVNWENERKKWKADIRVNGKLINLGRFISREDAIAARKAANIKYNFHENHGAK